MTPEEVKAFEGYREKALKGDPVAQTILGACYYVGNGVAKNQVEAAKWWRKGAEQGNAFAQSNLGACYRNGEGVAKDFAQSVSWFRIDRGRFVGPTVMLQLGRFE